ncbi:MAG TPA: hypothetical protein VH186_01100 [Chloroflexia bacterium]|nr:hypothetical protein [Chloroflexia bacterium]
MLRRTASYYPLAVTVLFGLLVSLLPISPALGDNIGACQGNTTTTATLTLGGRVITPSQILLANGSQSCADGGKKLSLISMSHTIVVSPNGTPAQNGTALFTAMTTISNSTPSVDNPWLLKLEPGNYDLGMRALSLKPFVDLEGSGEGTTVISSTAGGVAVITASNSEIRFVKITNTTSLNNPVAIYVPDNATNVRLTHVTASATDNGSNNSYSLIVNAGDVVVVDSSTISAYGSPGNSASYGLFMNGGSVTVKNSTVSASGNNVTTALYNHVSGGTVLVQNSTLTGTGGVSSYGLDVANTTVTVQNSALTATGASSYGLYSSGGTINIGTSQLSGSTGSAYKFGGTLTCVASYNGSFAPLSAACQ